MSHFLQSPAWATFQQSLGRTAVNDQGEGWSYQAFLERGKMNSRLYAPYGPVAESPAALKAALKSLQRQGKQLGAAFLRVEPTGGASADSFEALGLRRVARKQPEHTQRVNLDRPFDEVLADMTKSSRNLHRNYTKKGLSVRKSTNAEDVEHLVRLLGTVSDRTGMHGHPSDYIRETAHSLIPQGAACMYLAEYEDEVIAVSLVFDDHRRRYYAHAAADTEHRRLHAGTILVTQMIEDSTNSEQQEFDLYGVVPPEVTDHEWSGFSKFKRGFGGEQVDYNGTWELPLKKTSYALYSLARRVLGDRL